MTELDVGIDVVARAKGYLRAIEAARSFDEIAAFLDPEIVQVELPNRLAPNGARRDLDGMRTAFERGRAVVARQRFDVKHAVAQGPRVALEVEWTGVLGIPLGALAVGDTLRAYFAMFLDFRGDRIVAQRNYDCFEP